MPLLRVKRRMAAISAAQDVGVWPSCTDLFPENCAAWNEQIIGILKQTEAGMPAAEVCRQHGISEQTLYRWKAKYGGMDVGEAKRLKQLEEENRKLKPVVVELTLDNRALKDVLSKKGRACQDLVV